MKYTIEIEEPKGPKEREYDGKIWEVDGLGYPTKGTVFLQSDGEPSQTHLNYSATPENLRFILREIQPKPKLFPELFPELNRDKYRVIEIKWDDCDGSFKSRRGYYYSVGGTIPPNFAGYVLDYKGSTWLINQPMIYSSAISGILTNGRNCSLDQDFETIRATHVALLREAKNDT